ncbi:MAG: sulfatase-like hydrolase/transferase, partial [Plesiomonas shigelloides]
LTQKYNTSLLYISDHGESLGESGLYLHGTPYSVAPDTQTQVPMMLWMSPQFIAQRDINAECLKQKAGSQAYSHDNLFHTLLGITGVKTQAKNGELDILAACQS